MNHLFYNYMCDPYGPGQCNRACCQPHAAGQVTGTLSGEHEIIQPTYQAEIDALQAQLVQMREDSGTFKDQLAVLDHRAEDQRLDRERMLGLMQKVVEELRYVGDELQQKREEVADLEMRVKKHREQNDRALSTVEQELNELLSQIDQ